MKKKSIISLLICCMTMGMMNTSCQDMLTPDSERHAYEVAQDTLYSYWGVLKSLQNIAERYVILNECRGDLVDGSTYVSDTIAAIINFGKNGYEEKYKDGQCAYLRVMDYYHVINSCNAYIAKCDTAIKVSTGQQTSYMLKEYAQVAAIRAWVYMQLIYAYGNVPFYTTPMLTTDEINQFISNPNHQMANAKNIADLLGPDLETVYNQLDGMFGDDKFPAYNEYGNINVGSSTYDCHSMRTMFPVDVVLGDLYLMQGGNKATYEKAASYYYKFLNSKYCGPLECNKYFSSGNVLASVDEPQYAFYTNTDKDYNRGIPYLEKRYRLERGRYRQEAITCIPSNKGRLDGHVFTDINRLFGFEASLSASGSGDASNSNVDLSYHDNGYRRELIPSKGYEALCDSQKYECYIGSGEGDAYQELVVLPGVGDARRSWIYNTKGSVKEPKSDQYNLPVGDATQFGKLISKQNPEGEFSTVYPMIYRKSTIWLRYAEAINRAGFPSYAFAILKNGLVSLHYYWFPTQQEDPADSTYYLLDNFDLKYLDYGPKDPAYLYLVMTSDTTGIFWGHPANDPALTGYITSLDSLQTYVEDKYQAIAQAINDSIDAGLKDGDHVTPETFDPNMVYLKVHSFNNYPSDECESVLWYLDRREVNKAGNYPFMNFNNQRYLEGYQGTIKPYFKKNIYDGGGFKEANEYFVGSSGLYLTIGVHQRGCGILRSFERDFKSAYDYVDLVAKKLKENGHGTFTKEDIYGQGNNPVSEDWLIEAVEDIIIDENALELAFEGCRFSDLARIAIRRGQPQFLAERVAKRSGSMNMSMYNILMDQRNWYLPFPVEQ
jgi:hypothetical protein